MTLISRASEKEDYNLEDCMRDDEERITRNILAKRRILKMMGDDHLTLICI